MLEGIMRQLLFVFVAGCLLFPAQGVLAQEREPPLDPQPMVYVVQPGDTLFSIARRYGMDLKTLVRLNQLSDPRDIYVGQRLRLQPLSVDVRSWEYHVMQLGEDLSLLACHNNVDAKTVAQVNGLLNPSVTLLGSSMLLPDFGQPSTVGIAGADLTPIEIAFRYDQSLWDVLRLNPQPFYAGECMAVPGDGDVAAGLLPYPLKSLSLSRQPVERGETVVLAVETSAPALCDIAYLNKTARCFDQDDGHLYALLSFSPMLEPDTYEMEVRLRSGDSEVALTLPMVVTAGRFGFERIDLPPSRQALFDPDLLRNESVLVDSVANVHTAQRYWQVPFAYPVQSSVSSYFGARRSYGGSYNSYHSGVDFRASTGVPVKTPSAGTVVLAENLMVRGNAIIIDHGWGVLTGYWHLSKIDVEAGQYVTQGQVIGRVGNTGLSTGSHLHWQLWVDGKPVNPLQWTDIFYTFPDPQPPVVDSLE